MTQTIKQQAIVKPGGVIEICHPGLTVGAIADVLITLNKDQTALPSVPFSSLFGKVKNCYQSAEQADAFIRQERDAWD